MSSEGLPRPRRKWPHVLLGIVLLLSGIVIGASVTIAITHERLMTTIHEPEKVPSRMAGRLRWSLGLDDAQAQKVEAILTRAQLDLTALRDKVLPDVEATLERTRQEVETLLTPRQAEDFNHKFQNLRDRLIPNHEGH